MGTFAGRPEGSTITIRGLAFKISYRGGDGNDIVLSGPRADENPGPGPGPDSTPDPTPDPNPNPNPNPSPDVDYFLSEGATGSFFDTDVLIANPHAQEAPVTLTFSKEDGTQVVAQRVVPAHKRG